MKDEGGMKGEGEKGDRDQLLKPRRIWVSCTLGRAAVRSLRCCWLALGTVSVPAADSAVWRPTRPATRWPPRRIHWPTLRRACAIWPGNRRRFPSPAAANPARRMTSWCSSLRPSPVATQ